MSTGVPAVDALFGALRGISAMPEGFRQEGVPGVFKAFIAPKPFEVAGQMRELRDEKAPEIEALQTAIDHVDNVNDFLTQVTPMMSQIRYELGMHQNPVNEQAYARLFGTLNEKYQQKARDLIGLGSPGANVDPYEAIRTGMVTGDQGAVKYGQSLLDVMKQNKQNTINDERVQTEDLRQQLLQQKLDAGPTLQRVSTGGGAGAAREPKPLKPYNAMPDLQLLTRSIPTDADGMPTAPPPAAVFNQVNANRRAAGLSPLTYSPSVRGGIIANIDRPAPAGRRNSPLPAAVGATMAGVPGLAGPAGAANIPLDALSNQPVPPSGAFSAPAPTPTPGATGGISAAPYIPQVEDAPPAEMTPLMQQQPNAAPTRPVLSARALRASLIAQGMDPSQADALVRARLAQQQPQ